MSIIEITLLILATGVVLCLAFVLGSQQSYQKGYSKGFADGLEKGRELGREDKPTIRVKFTSPKDGCDGGQHA